MAAMKVGGEKNKRIVVIVGGFPNDLAIQMAQIIQSEIIHSKTKELRLSRDGIGKHNALVSIVTFGRVGIVLGKACNTYLQQLQETHKNSKVVIIDPVILNKRTIMLYLKNGFGVICRSKFELGALALSHQMQNHQDKTYGNIAPIISENLEMPTLLKAIRRLAESDDIGGQVYLIENFT